MAQQTFDFDTYLPDFSEISNEKFLEVRERIEAFYAANFPDVDTSPNIVVGDLIITPMAHYRAAEEIALSRFMSDLDLENVADGVIWNCDFVTEYLKNFATVDRDNLRSTGIIRLTFTEDSNVVIDRRIRFNFGTSDATSNTFNLRLNNDGPFNVVRVGQPRLAGTNSRNLVQVAESLYVVDVPVIGVMDTQVEAGDEATIDVPLSDLPTLQSAEALVDFDFGLPPDGLPTIAKKTRDTFYSCTPNNRGGAANFISKEFPDVEVASPVLTGDFEMLRDFVNPLGVPQGKLDIHVRSSSLVDNLIVRLKYDPVADKFRGVLDFPEVPLKLNSIAVTGNEALTFDPEGSTVQTIVQTTDRVRLPLLTASYSVYQKFWISLDMPRDPNTAVPLIETVFVSGEQFADFDISYLTDPVIRPVEDAITSTKSKPVNIDIVAKGMVPIVLNDMTVVYTREGGTTVSLETAQSEIYTYLTAQVGYPRLYTDARVFDSMFFVGAKDVKEINLNGYIQFSPARYVLDDNYGDPLLDWEDAISNSKPVPRVDVLRSSDLKPNVLDPYIGDPTRETLYAIGDRTVGYVIEQDSIGFSESAT
jgi:hypothetical protein